jgi:RNA polymerase sigma-70 factor, ECF subfamily
VALSEIDRSLLQRCLGRKPRAWEDFVDRFVGLVVHVINHTAQSRSTRLTPQDVEDLAAEVFLAVVNQDFAILRRFRGESSLATYLTVVARRVVVRELLKRRTTSSLTEAAAAAVSQAEADSDEQRIHDRDEVTRLLSELEGPEAEVVRLYHLEGKSYREISSEIGIAENSIGPTLSRARAKMRRAADSTTPT